MSEVVDTHAPVTVRALIGKEWRDGHTRAGVRDPYRGGTVGYMPVSSERDCNDALEAATRASRAMAMMPGYERAALLRRAADATAGRAPEIGRVMALETGKALQDCLAEVERAADTLRLCAEEAVRIEGEHIPMEASAIGAGKLGLMLRFPVGVVAAITPFNGPVNLAVHKLGPALAAGNSIVLKPSPKAPLCAHLFVEAVLEAGPPPGAVNTLYGDAIAPQLVSDPRVAFVSFTGSIPVGKIIRNSIGMKRAALELGGVGPTFVHHDADLEVAARACARNSMLLAGQSCISVQNVFVERTVYEPFRELVHDEVSTIRFGDPMDPATEVGTLIDEQAARRVQAMVGRATGCRGELAVRRGPGRRADGGDGPDRGPSEDGGRERGSVRPGHDLAALRRDRPDLRVHKLEPLRPAVRDLHKLSGPRACRVPRSPHRRRDRQRNLAVAVGPDALRRSQGQRYGA